MVCGVAALGLLLYPLVGEFLSERYHSDVETTYTEAIVDTDDAELTAQREAAEQYNAMLSGAAIAEGGASAPPPVIVAPDSMALYCSAASRWAVSSASSVSAITAV